jgi:hypothetical protein
MSSVAEDFAAPSFNSPVFSILNFCLSDLRPRCGFITNSDCANSHCQRNDPQNRFQIAKKIIGTAIVLQWVKPTRNGVGQCLTNELRATVYTNHNYGQKVTAMAIVIVIPDWAFG